VQAEARIEAMSALPLSTDSPSRDTERRSWRFRQRLDDLACEFVALWRGTPSTTPELGPPITRLRQFSNARGTRRLIDEIAVRIERYPENETAREAWRARLQDRVRRFGEERFGWPEGYRELLLADEFWASTVGFVRRARRFAPSIETEDLFQALRNVWIMNSAQMLLDLEVRETPAVFAYSMLYPWTDNYLDDPQVGAGAKRAFNTRLGRRLSGQLEVAANRHEAEVFDLVATIEEDLSRVSYPEAHFSLQAIHRAQVDSLRQHRTALSRDDLLALSVRKGGSSVLTDGYLVAGELKPDEERFMFGYGVFLQLLDDLQDIGVDRAAGHRTLFTEAADAGTLDQPVARLYRFIHRCLDGGRRFGSAAFDQRKDLIRRNCVALLVGAVANQPSLVSRRFGRALESRWPLSFRASRRLQRYARRRFQRLQSVLQETFGADSVLDLICRSEN